jgi:Holliday junction resolvase RusA-like endonuclease
MRFLFETMPVSTNHLYGQRGGKRYLLPEVRECKEVLAWEAASQYRRAKLLEKPLKVEVDLYWPDWRKHDVDNIKVLLDALTGIVWKDDGQIVDLHTRKHFDRERPRVEMEVSDFTG